jgi:hypothetical protein
MAEAIDQVSDDFYILAKGEDGGRHIKLVKIKILHSRRNWFQDNAQTNFRKVIRESQENGMINSILYIILVPF